MKKKYFILILSLILVIFYFQIFLKKECLNVKSLIQALKDFGFHVLLNCKEEQAIKKYINKNNLLVDISTYVSRTILKKYDLDIVNFESNEKNYADLQNEYFPQFNKKNLLIEGQINKINKKKFENHSDNYNIISDNSYSQNDNPYRQNKDNANSKFYDLIEINKKNINQTKLVWKHESINSKNNFDIQSKWIENIQTSPLYSNGKIFFITANRKLICANISNGNIIWEKQLLFQPSKRGFLLDFSKKEKLEVIFLPIDNKIYKLNAQNGKLIKNFSKSGYINNVSTSFSPVIFNDDLIVINQRTKKLESYNKINGDFKFSVSLFLKTRNFHGANPWGGMALDEINGIVYVVTGNPNPYSIGQKRIGSNEGSNSIVAIDVANKKILWNFQETLHDLWNLDIAFPPILTKVFINDEQYSVVIVISKIGNVIMLDRITGAPIFDIVYKKAPISNVPNEVTSPFQIFIEKPEPVTKFEWNPKDVDHIKFNNLYDYTYGWFQPMSVNIPYLFRADGPAWEGGAIDHKKQKMYTTVNQTSTLIRLYANSFFPHSDIPKQLKDESKIYFNKCSSCHGENRNGVYKVDGFEKIEKQYVPSLVGYYIFPNLIEKINNIEIFKKKHPNFDITNSEFEKINNLFKRWDEDLKINRRIQLKYTYSVFVDKDKIPIAKNPWGEIVSYDLSKGKIEWRVPFGYKIINNKEEKIGTFNKGGLAIASNDVIFATGTSDQKIIALDATNGDEIWSHKMEAPGSSPPILFYYNKKKYLAVNSTGGYNYEIKNKGSYLYVFELP